MEYDPGAVQKGNLCSQCPVLIEKVGSLEAKTEMVKEVNDRDHREIKEAQREIFALIRDMPNKLAGMMPATEPPKEPLLGLTGKQFIVVLILFLVAAGVMKALALIPHLG